MGPVEYLAVEFPGNEYSGEIVPALNELIDSGVIRIIDLLFIRKDNEGGVSWFELDDLGDAFSSPFSNLEGEILDLLNEEDALIAAENLAPNSSAGILVFENVWATRLRDAIDNANGRILDNERIPRDVVQAAMESASITVE